MSIKTRLQTIALASLLALSAMTSANALPISGTGALGSFTGSLTFSATASTDVSAATVVRVTGVAGPGLIVEPITPPSAGVAAATTTTTEGDRDA